MNSACLIAACAAANRHNHEQYYKQYVYLNSNCDITVYYKVRFRKYFHFNPITLAVPENKLCSLKYTHDYLLQYDIAFKTITVEPKSIADELTFTISSFKCKNGVDNYIKEHIKDYENSELWELHKDRIINTYIDEIKKKYNVEIDKSYLDYNIQYCWEVESDVR